MAASGFWDNQEKAREVIAESNRLKSWVGPWHELDAKAAELAELGELLEEEEDEELEAEVISEVEGLEGPIEALELRTMLQGSEDHRCTLMTVHHGAGVIESQVWAEMVTRM